MKYFSMFTGVGGFELGIGDRAECIGFSEIDKYANQLLANKFPNIRNYGDATKIEPSELPEFDMLCGGFPCQTFSIAGKRRGFEDIRGTMFFEIARVLEIKRPGIIFLENVKGLLNHNKGETFRKILQTMEELGYNVQWMVLNSKFFGIPQNRERVFIIANSRGKPSAQILPFRKNDSEIIGERTSERMEQIAQSLRARDYANWNGNMIKIQKIKEGGQGNRIYSTEGVSTTLQGSSGGQGAKTGLYAVPVLTPDRTIKRQNGRRFKEDGDPSFTLTKTDVHGVAMNIDGMKIRRLTPIECERLQGFPDNWTEGFSDTQRYKMMGNAVTVNVIKAIINQIWNPERLNSNTRT